MLLIAFVGVLASVLPVKAEPKGNPARWFTSSDIPPSELDRSRTTSYDLTIDENGKPIGCVTTNPSGSEIFDTTICNILMKRAHYKPAKDGSGNAMASIERGHFNWRPEGSGENRYSEDFLDVIFFSKSAKSTKSFSIT